MKTLLAVILTAAVMQLTACASCNLVKLQAATLSETSPAIQQLLTQAMQELAKKSVTLPTNAFVKSAHLALSDKVVVSEGNPRGLGMEHMPPHTFELQTDGKHCWMLYQNTQQKQKLDGINCKAVQ